MWDTLRTPTANSTTAREDMSEACRILAMLRWTNTSPGCRPRRVVSGTRESEQPSHRMAGDCPLARVGKRSGWDLETEDAQSLLEVRALVKASMNKSISVYEKLSRLQTFVAVHVGSRSSTVGPLPAARLLGVSRFWSCEVSRQKKVCQRI